ncbi:MAG: PEP-CTERM sorting domain-containing protein, partial [Planctomycetia bacterium]|nr:PEP-CTERM sorting domain-containing protein [Planctomycetia bacterium]
NLSGTGSGNIALSGTFTNTGTTTINLATSRQIVFSGNISGSGTLDFCGLGGAATQARFEKGSFENFNGEIKISGAVYVGLFGANSDLSNVTASSTNGSIFLVGDDTSSTFQLGSVSFTNSTAEIRPGGSSTALTTLQIGDLGNNDVFASKFNDYGNKQLAVEKVGTGTLTISGSEHTFTGGLSVTAGKVVVSGEIKTSEVTVGTAGTLEVTGTVKTVKNSGLLISSGVSSVVDSLEVTSTGRLLVTDGTVSTPLLVRTDLDYGDLFSVEFDFEDYTEYDGEEIVFLETVETVADMLTVEFSGSGTGWQYSTRSLDGSVLHIATLGGGGADVPEPSTWVLLLSSLVAGAFGRRVLYSKNGGKQCI